MLQQAARQRTDLHNLHRIGDVSASQNLQDVAVIGINVGNEHAPEHAPEHALNLGALSKNSNPQYADPESCRPVRAGFFYVVVEGLS